MPAGNATADAQEERRLKVRECWARGMRNPYAIGRELNCHGQTVRRDLVILRRRARKDVKSDEKMHLIREDIAAGYMADIAELDEVIKEARQYVPVKKQIKTDSEQEARTIETEFPKDYTAIANLFNRKLEARRKLAELYELMAPEVKKVVAQASAQASATAVVNLESVDDDDLISATKAVISRVSTQA